MPWRCWPLASVAGKTAARATRNVAPKMRNQLLGVRVIYSRYTEGISSVLLRERPGCATRPERTRLSRPVRLGRTVASQEPAGTSAPSHVGHSPNVYQANKGKET
jgi:hypothetical protein